MNNTNYVYRIAVVVALGGFLFGYDAAVISGVIGFITPEFDLTPVQIGQVVSSLTLTSTIAMFIVGPLSDNFGRKKVLIVVGLLYAASALFSALAPNVTVLIYARMIGGFAIGGALITAPLYIAEVAPAEKRGQIVSINQLNIVLGFSAAYFANYYIQQLSGSDVAWVTNLGIDTNAWRWMLGVEVVPALLFFLAMFFVPESPRWLLSKNRKAAALVTLSKINGVEKAEALSEEMTQSIEAAQKQSKLPISDLFKPTLRLVLIIGLIVGILQQITGINAVFFYANTIFEQAGAGKNAAFIQAIWVGLINVVFTIIAMLLIDKLGRKPLLLIGVAGIAISMFISAYGFHQATYTLSAEAIEALPTALDKTKLTAMIDKTYDNDVDFKNALQANLESKAYKEHESALIKAASSLNPILILIGILGFVASFAISLGPVMWVLFSELFPTAVRGLAISIVGGVNSVISLLVQFLFPIELAMLGNALTFTIYGAFAVIGFFLIARLLPETKGKTLEQIEQELAR